MTKLEEKLNGERYNDPYNFGKVKGNSFNSDGVVQSSPYETDAPANYIDNLLGYYLNFDNFGEIIVIVNGKVIVLDKQKIEDFLSTLSIKIPNNV